MFGIKNLRSLIGRTGSGTGSCYLLLLCLLLPSALLADRTHNIQNFFGERAPGFAGAYAAISDDPSGAIYNPAGLAFAYDGYISISASNYKEVKYVYESVFGPGQDYTRKYDKFTPNFLGALKRLDDNWMLGVSLINPFVETFDQSDRILFPVYQQNTARVSIDYSDDSSLLMGGPSIAYLITDKLSVGMSVLFFNDKQKNVTSVLFQNKDGSYATNNLSFRRKTMGFLPVVGLQYMPTDRFAVGLSASKYIVTSEFARDRASILNVTLRPAGGLQATLIEAEASDSGPSLISTNQGFGVFGPPATGSIPETWEGRLGFAYFVSQYLVFSADVIHTSGFQKDRNRDGYNAFQNIYIIASPNDPVLYREPTTNFAAGLEYFLTENFALRLGGYTNYANTPEKKETILSILDNVLVNSQSPATGYQITSNLGYLYEPDLSLENEHVDMTGYTLGVAFSSGTSSVSLTLSREVGKGWGNITPEGLPQQIRGRNVGVYITATTRN